MTAAARRAIASESDPVSAAIREEDGVHFAVWGPFVLRSAFQPIFRFRDGRLRIAAVEGLIRPMVEGSPVTPATFFARVEPRDARTVETICRTIHIRNGARFRGETLRLFLNFDPASLGDRASLQDELSLMGREIRAAGLRADQIVCEITENRAPSETELKRFVYLARAAGHAVAVDDFGSRNSDLARVEALAPDIVKFDGQWATRLLNSRAGFGLLRLMIGWFADRGIASVVEGIERTWQIELAEQAGAQCVQGFGIARPQLAPVDFRGFLREARVWPAATTEGGISVPDRGQRIA